MTNSNPPPAPFQFGLKHMLIAVLALCVWLAFVSSMGGAGAFVGAYVLVLVGSLTIIFVAGIGGREPLGCVGLVGLTGCAVLVPYLLSADWRAPRETAKRTDCVNNLKQIGLALENYHQTYGSFPPAFIADQNGKPKHSWRILILPFLEQQGLYEQYDFRESWDGPNNRQVVRLMPRCYWCPNNSARSTSGKTNYMAVIGAETAWPGVNTRTLGEFTDGPGQTIIVVEVANSNINWTEPRDLYVASSASQTAAKRKPGSAGSHPGGNNVVFTDGSTRCLPNDLDPQVLRAMLTLDGGETIDWISSDRPRIKEER